MVREDSPRTPPLRVVLADGSGIFGQGLRLLLELAGAVVEVVVEGVVEGVVGDGVALVAAALTDGIRRRARFPRKQALRHTEKEALSAPRCPR